MNIHKIKNDTKESIYYTLIGNEDFLDESGNPCKKIQDNFVYAKAVKNKLPKAFQSNTFNNESVGYSFYIKVLPNKTLYNPIQLYSVKSSKPSFIDSVCKNNDRFIEVNQAIFDKYITFLRTKNIQWLTEAQREIK
jgi:hypothetical protein